MEYHLADVNGKIVNYCDEVSNKDFSGGDFKQFVSGGAFTGRHPYSKRPTKVDKIPLMLCCANKIPPTTDDTEGYFRRFLIILAPNHVDERDKDPMLEMKLQAPEVKSAIFNWVLEGYRAFIKNEGKIEIASSVKEVVDEMKANSNSLRRWIDTMGYVAAQPEDNRATGWKSLKEWVQDYKRYCEDWGETPRSRSAVTEQFKKMNAVSQRRSDGVWYYLEVGPVETVKVQPEPVVDDLPAGNEEESLPF
jgi:putative DNA primase/helicase